MLAKKSYIDNNGKLTIPAKVRKHLHLKPGDEVSIKYTDSELVISTFRSNLERARNILSQYENLDLSNELKQQRQEDAREE
jgi:AbrB family looped-hinge helix DNA binding protein